jgi:hypothetical protein
MGLHGTVGFKVPREQQKEFQARLGECARKSKMEVWQFVSRLLDAWENEQPQGEDWRKWRDSIESKISELSSSIAIVNSIKLVKPIDNTDIQDIRDQRDPIENQQRIEDFHAAFNALERGALYVDIFELRRRLNWSRDVFDSLLCSLRDAGTIQLHAGDITTLTTEESADNFIDENGFRLGSVTWEGEATVELPKLPTPEHESILETEVPPVPEKRRLGRPSESINPKSESPKLLAIEQESVPEAKLPPVPEKQGRGRPSATAKTKPEAPSPAPRKRGRSPKAKVEEIQ